MALFLFFGTTSAQSRTDTLYIGLQQAEKTFIDSNLLLLASHYNVDAQKFLIEQAKVWQNPTLNTDFMLGANGKFLQYKKNEDGSYNGQYYVQVQQLILTAQKRGKLVALASTNARIAELQLKDLVRNLRYQLNTSFFTLDQQYGLLYIYNEQAKQLDILSGAMKKELDAGNIARKDYVRVQAVAVSLSQDILALKRDMLDTENDLKILLKVTKPNIVLKPIANKADKEAEIPNNLEQLVSAAMSANPAYLLQQWQATYQSQALAYQKALRVPDVTLGPNFDRNSNFAPNYVGLGVSVPLPVFNKNKGNIKSAAAQVRSQEVLVKDAEAQLRTNIATAREKLLVSLQYASKSELKFYADYEEVYRNMLLSYKQRQINLLEFLDFFNDYNDGQKKLLEQRLGLILSKAELNYHLGK